MELSHRYDDIIDLAHHVSETRPHMPLLDRAAQFAPFAALTGYGEAVEETARLTEKKLELDEEQKAAVSRVLTGIQARIRESPVVSVLYFIPDVKKSGGQYVTALGRAKKLDAYGETLLLADGSEIAFEDIYSLELADGEMHADQS